MRYSGIGNQNDQHNSNSNTQVVYHRKRIFGESTMSQSKLWKRDSASLSLHRGDQACPADLREGQDFNNNTNNMRSLKIQPRKIWERESSSSDGQELNKNIQYTHKNVMQPVKQVQTQVSMQIKKSKTFNSVPLNISQRSSYPVTKQTIQPQYKIQKQQKPQQKQSQNKQPQQKQQQNKQFQPQIQTKFQLQPQPALPQSPQSSPLSPKLSQSHLSVIRHQRELLQKSAQLDRKVQHLSNQNKILLSQHFIMNQVLVSNRNKLNSLINMQRLEIVNVDYKRKLYDAKEKVEEMVRRGQDGGNGEIVRQILDVLCF